MGAFSKKKKKRDVRQYFPVQPMGSYAGQREVNVLVQHAPTRQCCSLRLGGGRRRGRDGCTRPELCKPGRTVLSKLSSVMKVKH